MGSFLSIFGYIGEETPKFALESKQKTYQIRNYGPQLRATFSFTIEKTLYSSESSRKGFWPLANFIFGKNHSVTDGKSKSVSMTAPVFMLNDGKKATMSFVMPSKFTKSTLPVPDNAEVQIEEIPSQKFAVITFSGFFNEKNILKKERELRESCLRDNVNVCDGYMSAGFNPPWTIPFFKTNEVMIMVKD